MENKITVKENATVKKDRMVVSKDGVKMTYEEWLDMVRSERN